MTTAAHTPVLPAELCPRPAGPPGSGLRPSVLRELVTTVAARPGLWAEHVRFDLGERHFQRLHHDPSFEVWLICWELGQDTLLHDHGGSVGAFAVARGNLIEDHADLDGHRLHTRAHRTGDAVAFGPRYLHNLVNIAAEPAITVHAYSRPLSTMNFYCWLPTGPHHLREIPCDSPEPDVGDLEQTAARTRAAHR